MKISEIVLEGFFDQVKKVIKSIGSFFSSLKFGGSKVLEIPNPMLEDGRSSRKGSNGLIAEYVAARHLAEELSKAGIPVDSDIGSLKDLENSAIERLKKDMDQADLKRAINQGLAIGQSMFTSIVQDSQDLIFTEFKFNAAEYSFDIINVGASTTSDKSADLKIIVSKESTKEVYQEILISCKAYRGSSTSQGSKSSLATISNMFGGDSDGKIKPADFEKYFGSLGKEYANAVAEYKNFAKNWVKNSKDPEAIAIRKKYADRGVSLSSKMTNILRGKEVGAAFAKDKGYNSAHNLAEKFALLFNENFKKIKKDKKAYDKFKSALMDAAGFDYITTYNAIADEKGIIKEVVNSNVSGGYKKIYDAFAQNCDVILTVKPESATIDVTLVHGSDEIKSLTLSVWKEGTIQFKFDSKK